MEVNDFLYMSKKLHRDNKASAEKQPLWPQMVTWTEIRFSQNWCFVISAGSSGHGDVRCTVEVIILHRTSHQPCWLWMRCNRIFSWCDNFENDRVAASDQRGNNCSSFEWAVLFAHWQENSCKDITCQCCQRSCTHTIYLAVAITHYSKGSWIVKANDRQHKCVIHFL